MPLRGAQKLKAWDLLLGGLVIMENDRHCWCTHLNLHARLQSSHERYCLSPRKVVISGGLAQLAFSEGTFYFNSKRSFFPLLALGASFIG